MAIPPRTATEGTFFITAITYRRRSLFQLPANAELFLETLQHYRAVGHYKLYAFVVMPDHIHLLLTPQNKTISQVMNLIKGGFSRRLAANFRSGNAASPTTSSRTAKTTKPASITSTRTPSAPTSPKTPKTTPTPPPTGNTLQLTNPGRARVHACRHYHRTTPILSGLPRSTIAREVDEGHPPSPKPPHPICVSILSV